MQAKPHDRRRQHLLLRRSCSPDVVPVARATAPDALAALSERERQVLRLIGRGHALRDIAAELDLSVKTVATYRDRLKVKLALDHARDLLIVARNIVEI